MWDAALALPGFCDCIGYVGRSTFSEKWGVPRQSGFVRDSRACIHLRPNHLVTEDALSSVRRSMFLVILFFFHKNENAHAYYENDNNSHGNSRRRTAPSFALQKTRMKSKVHPPKLLNQGAITEDARGKRAFCHGGSTGIFGCRTPHRPNPVGLSICRIVRSSVLRHSSTLEVTHEKRHPKTSNEDLQVRQSTDDGKTAQSMNEMCCCGCSSYQHVLFNEMCVHDAPMKDEYRCTFIEVSGVDFIEGTPVLGLWPYCAIPAPQSLSLIDMSFPSWIRHPLVSHHRSIRAACEVYVSLAALVQLLGPRLLWLSRRTIGLLRRPMSSDESMRTVETHSDIDKAASTLVDLQRESAAATQMLCIIKEALSLDPRSRHSRDRHPDGIFSIVLQLDSAGTEHTDRTQSALLHSSARAVNTCCEKECAGIRGKKFAEVVYQHRDTRSINVLLVRTVPDGRSSAEGDQTSVEVAAPQRTAAWLQMIKKILPHNVIGRTSD